MDISASAAATQLATQRVSFAQSQIKQNAQAERQVADILTQAAEAGAQASSSSKVNIVV